MQKRTFPHLNDTTILLLFALGVALLHFLFNGKYGFHRDELDILMNARRLDWGYVAYPPFTPLVARLALELFDGWLQGMRLFSALGQGLAVFLVGLMARDMGGRRATQLMAALAVAIAPAALTAGTLIQYMSFDYLWWVVIAFCFVRLLKTEEPRWWLAIGASIGMAMQNKYTAVFFIAGLVAATLLTPNRRYLRSPWLWAGAGLALLIYLPNLLWQVQHDFISLEFLGAIHARDIQWGRTADFLPEQFLISANPFTVPLWLFGLAALLFSAAFKRFRLLGIAFLVTFGLLWLSQGRAYYVAPAYAMLLAAGSVAWQNWLDGRRAATRKALWAGSWAFLSLGALVGIVLVKPIAPINSALWAISSEINGEVVEMVGWEDLAAQVGQIYAALPEQEKAGAVILAGNYGEAGAFDLYAPQYGLPPVISGANSLWQRGYGASDPGTVIVVGFDRQQAAAFFDDCQVAGFVSNRYAVKNEETSYHTGLYVCRKSRRSWSELWQEMQWFQ